MIMPSEQYHLVVRWRARPENAASCAVRLGRALASLVNAHWAFAQWNVKAPSRTAAGKPAWEMPPKSEELTRVFDDNKRHKDATGELWPEMGYVVSAWNGLDRPYAASLAVWSGAYGDWIALPNHVDLDLSPAVAENADLMSTAVLKQLFIGLATAWEPDCGNLVSRDYWKRAFAEGPYPLFRSGWMTYLAAQYASRVTPPPSAIVERVAGGGMLLLATEERFSMDNAAHLAAADAIQAALAPIQEMVPSTERGR
jgi:hypothetical protein